MPNIIVNIKQSIRDKDIHTIAIPKQIYFLQMYPIYFSENLSF